MITRRVTDNGSTAEGRGVASVLIPAYEAAGFIDRTLRCARAQTYARVRIIVSVDRSEDATGEICRAHATEDTRIEVHTQPQRLGWAANVNFLLDRAAATEFATLYFHDDLVEPEYCTRLVEALSARPDAASAHCDVAQFGTVDTHIAGRGYEGPDALRLLEFLTSHRMPSVLRSMTRTARTDHLRLATGTGGVWANQPFQMLLVAAGPVLHVPETLYRKWSIREGGTTHGWGSLPFERLLAAYRANAVQLSGAIAELEASPAEREVLRFALGVRLALSLRRAEALAGVEEVHPPDILHPDFTDLTPPVELVRMPTRIRRQCESLHARLERRNRRAHQPAAVG